MRIQKIHAASPAGRRFLSRAFLLVAGWWWMWSASAQNPYSHMQSPYGKVLLNSEAAYDSLYGIRHITTRPGSKNCILKRQVYGWHPFSCGSAYKSYDFALLSTVAYYGYAVDMMTGSYSTVHQWRETELVEWAHSGGAQVELTASLAGTANISRLLRNPQACRTFCDSVVAMVKLKDADGVCVDFHGIRSEIQEPFADLMDSLSAALLRWRKEATLTMAVYPLDPEQAYNYERLTAVVDRFVLLGDVYNGKNPQSGPVAPLRASTLWGEDAFETMLQRGLAAVPREKIIAAVPYYGYEWPTASAAPGSATRGRGKFVLLRDYEAMDSSAYLQWDSTSSTGWILHAQGNSHRQLWIDQVSSLSEKYTLLKQKDIGGVAIWALGYDHGSDKYWDLLRSQFADCEATNTDQLLPDSRPVTPGLEGPTSAERNIWNWVWVLVGGVIAVAIILLVKKYM